MNWLDWILTPLFSFFRKRAKDAVTLKKEIAEILQKEEKRIVVFIDDLDRLESHEVREVLGAVKALGDFPWVSYVISFDRERVAKAISSTMGVDGDEYLEKIVQIQVSLPKLDGESIQKAFFSEIDAVIGPIGFTKFDEEYWGMVFHSGLKRYINNYRDVIRIRNSICVSYPRVVGEVNTVDFIALEILRIFEPKVDRVLRNNIDEFVGIGSSRNSNIDLVFHTKWLSDFDDNKQAFLKDFLMKIFPRLEGIWSNTWYESTSEVDWKRQLRICTKETADVYFRMGLSRTGLGRRAFEEIIRSAPSSGNLSDYLQKIARIKHSDGTSQAADFLDNISDLAEEISSEEAKSILGAILVVGDYLLTERDAGVGFMFYPNEIRLGRAIVKMLERIPAEQRYAVISGASEDSRSIGRELDIIRRVEEAKDEKDVFYCLIERLWELKQRAKETLSNLSDIEFLSIKGIPFFMYRFEQWGYSEIVKEKLIRIVHSDSLLTLLIESHLSYVTRTFLRNGGTTRIPMLNPTKLVDLVGIELILERAKTIDRKPLSERQRLAIDRFVKSCENIKVGIRGAAAFSGVE
jgi:predicted KAP-like P-loop ATPase